LKAQNILLIGFAVVVLILVAGKAIHDKYQAVELLERGFSCRDDSCEYSFELINHSSQSQTGLVYIHFRENAGMSDFDATSKKSESFEKSFTLGPNDSLVVTDVQQTSIHNVKAYYAVSTSVKP
jgi:hypothetical protein